MTKNIAQPQFQTQKAWVVFCAHTDLPWLRFLKSGFRHCFILLNDNQVWVSIDPLSTHTDIQIHHHLGGDYDLPRWLETQGFKVLSAEINTSHTRPAPWMAFTCVEAIKRTLGIHRRFIFTPWQLYKFLKNKNENENQKQNVKGKFLWAI